METIIGLLFILLPVIMKLIAKRLEAAGKPEGAKAVKTFVEEHLEVEEWIEEAFSESVEAPETEPVAEGEPVRMEPVLKGQQKKEPAGKPVIQEPEPEKKGEKIDPKKLVIYSEIMKPKF